MVKEDLKRHEKTSNNLKVIKNLNKEKFKITGVSKRFTA